MMVNMNLPFNHCQFFSFIPYHGPASTIGLCFVAMVFGGHFPSSSKIHQIFGEVFASPETRALEDVCTVKIHHHM